MGRELQGKVNSGSHTWHLQNQRGEGGGLHRVYGYIRINLLVPKQECSTRSRVLGQSNIRVVHILRVEEETILTLNILHKRSYIRLKNLTLAYKGHGWDIS